MRLFNIFVCQCDVIMYIACCRQIRHIIKIIKFSLNVIHPSLSWLCFIKILFNNVNVRIFQNQFVFLETWFYFMVVTLWSASGHLLSGVVAF